MKYLDKLESQSIFIIREAYYHVPNLAMLWSVGKDSTVLVKLCQKAFFDHIPIPLVHRHRQSGDELIEKILSKYEKEEISTITLEMRVKQQGHRGKIFFLRGNNKKNLLVGLKKSKRFCSEEVFWCILRSLNLIQKRRTL